MYRGSKETGEETLDIFTVSFVITINVIKNMFVRGIFNLTREVITCIFLRF